MRTSRFHGRHESEGRQCEHPRCADEGEFRAPGNRVAGFDGPGDWRWFCLDHVREFNAGYDWFEGMNADEIYAAQAPGAGWATETRAFNKTAGVDGMPRWSDFDDPLDAIGARMRSIKTRAAREVDMGADPTGRPRFSRAEMAALETMNLGSDTDRRKLRRRYSELVRRFHPDRNGGDRAHEDRLGEVVAAYQMLKASGALR
ncbi:DnaJ domain-containing protein [Alteripontixanthobacter maritimus]|nr:J domain-containing protein [Alteripontixanthobacter maritimus]